MTRGERNIQWIEAHCFVPEGRLVGQPVKLLPFQRNIITGIYDSPTRRAIISFGRKNGKGLALDTPIPTPSGWTTMGELREGDHVIGSDGKPTRVEFVSPVHTGLRCWRLTFSDGSQVVADEQHRWLTRHSYRPWAKARRNGSGNGGRVVEGVVTTPQIAESVFRSRKDGGREHNHKITIAPAVETACVEGLPVDPYVLGAWLGDGASASARFTCGAEDLGAMSAEISLRLGGDVGITQPADRAATIRTGGLGLQVALRDAGVLGDKHIPAAYFDAGTQQRWELLQGLMDTDGTVNRNGDRYPRPSFSGKSELLCRDVWRLARSLGLKATLRSREVTCNGVPAGTAWEVSFPASKDHPVFRLERKQRLLASSVGSRSGTVSIVSCDEVESVPTVCIKVAAADSLFLAGHGCIPTHNTALSAFLLLLHLCGPEAKVNSQLYSAAQSRDQAAILFHLAAKIVRMNPDLAQYVTIRDTAKELLCPELGTKYKALSADASTAYGLSPVFVVHDELGQVVGPRSELYDALETASGAQESPLTIIISTQAPTDADLLSQLIDVAKKREDPETKLWLFSATENCDPFAESSIKEANPAYGIFQNADEVMRQAATAKRMPSSENSYRNLILNQRVNMTNPFVSRAAWEACAGEIDDDAFGGPVYLGMDLSARADLTAIVAVAHRNGNWNVKPFFFAPFHGVAERSVRDRVPYDLWAEQGFLHLTPGSSVDYDFIADWLVNFCSTFDVKQIAFDRWRMDVMKAALSRVGGIDLPMTPFGQGVVSMAPALDTLETIIANGQLRHGAHPVLTMCAGNAVAISDPAGNRKLDKSKATGRIDGMVALTMAIGVGTKEAAAPPPPDYNIQFFSIGR